MLDVEERASIHELPQQRCEPDRRVATTLQLRPTAYVFLGGRDAGNKRRGTGERPGARKTGLPETTLHLDASADSWRVWPYLDHHLPGIG
jgi:hypothetical protein